MRYRIYDVDGYVGAYIDRDSFSESFLGSDPNYPIRHSQIKRIPDWENND